MSLLPNRFLSSLGVILGFSFAVGVSAGEFEHKIPLDRQKSGNYYITGTITDTLGGKTEVQFMVDTGAGMVTLAERTFELLSRDLRVKPS
jgi:predicted aspartyl protease